MKCLNTALCLLCGFVVIQESECVTAADIVKHARSQIGSKKWLYINNHVTGRNTNKCNIFVADVIKHVGADAPNRWPWWYSPIGAREWGNPKSTYLTKDPNWSLCTPPKNVPGDVIAENGHVGIVTGKKRTTSSSSVAKPRGLIVENDWGFRPGQNPTCWRFKYKKPSPPPPSSTPSTTQTTTKEATSGWEPTAIGTGTHTMPPVTYTYEVTEASETPGPSTTTGYY